MASVRVSELTKTFGRGERRATAIDALDFDVNEGELLVLLGPSGCGKTTILRCLAGLEKPDSGRIEFGDRAVFDSSRRVNLNPEHRNIGLVFQSFALWPHMSVADNIDYPLRSARWSPAQRRRRVREVLDIVECGPLRDRYPAQLSGGQQQRVALARALAAKPAVLLFDEPLSSLDARLRDQLRAELHRLHREVGFSGIYVTHDQQEALHLGTRIALLRTGKLEQLGAPAEVYEQPASAYAASFLGGMNEIAVEVRNGVWSGGIQPMLPAGGDGAVADGRYSLVLRPSRLTLTASAPRNTGELVSFAGCRVLEVQYLGSHVECVVLVGQHRVRVEVPPAEHTQWRVGEDVTVTSRLHDLMLYDEATSRRVVVGSDAGDKERVGS